MGAAIRGTFWFVVIVLAVVMVIAVVRDDLACLLSSDCGTSGGPPGAQSGLHLETIPPDWQSCAAEEEWFSPSAIHNMLREANSGNVLAQYSAAVAYLTGLGVECDPRQGANWMEQAAMSGLPQAQYSYALLAQWGFGASQSQKTARHWYRSAAASQHGGAINALTVLQFVKEVQGESATFDVERCVFGDCLVEVRYEFDRAARFGSAHAMVNAGFVSGFIAQSLEGQGHFQAADEFYADTYFWYSLASLYLDDTTVRGIRKALAGRMDPQLVQALDEEAAAWLPDKPLPPANLDIDTDPTQF